MTSLLRTLLSVLALLSAQEGRPPGPPASPVEVVPVNEADLAESTVILGSAEARRVSVVAAAIEGQVIEYLAREGAAVKRGDVLAHLRDDILTLELKGAEASLAEIREWHAKAKRELDRLKDLIVKDAATRKELESAETDERAFALRIPKAEAEVEVLRSNIEKKRVKAPFDGRVVREMTEVGEWLAAGGAVARLVDLSSIFVRFEVPERHIRHLREGLEISVSLGAARAAPYSGKVVSISGEGDRAARTFSVRVEIPNDGALRSGMSAQASFPSGEQRRTLLVPKDAVLLEGGGSQVFVVEEGVALKKAIRTGAETGDRIEVIAGLKKGDSVVVRGNERLQPGARVRIVESSSPGPEPGSSGKADPGKGGPGN